MPATLVSRPAVSGAIDLSSICMEVAEDATLDDGAPRVAMQLTVPLSFADVLGLLAYAPSAFLTYDAIEGPNSGAEVRYAVSFALLNTSVFEIHEWGQRAMRLYEGCSLSELAVFVKRVAPVITRVFGLPAPVVA